MAARDGHLAGVTRAAVVRGALSIRTTPKQTVPNIASAKKNMRKSRAAAVRNRAQRSALRTALKKARAADPAAQTEVVVHAVSLLDHAARNGWSAWHGAAAAGIGPRQGLNARPQMIAAAMVPARAAQVVVPNQFAVNLPAQDAYAACGPVAAVAVARWLGQNVSVPQAMELAKRSGWTSSGGMNGVANEKRLLDAMRIRSQLEVQVNWQRVQAAASGGNAVILSTPQHYWVIDGYDPKAQRYHVGQSGLAYQGGAEWMTKADIERLGGAANGALYVPHPAVVAARPTVQVNQRA